MIKRLFNNQKGDTILEVLLAVTVLSLVMTTSMSLVNKSVQNNRQAAERGEAYKIAQSEVEKLKRYMSSGNPDLPDENTYFCVNSDATGFENLGSGLDFPADRNSDLGFESGVYTNANDKGCYSGNGVRYYKIIHRGTDNVYTTYIRWASATGRSVDESTIVHKLYPSSTLEVSRSSAISNWVLS